MSSKLAKLVAKCEAALSEHVELLGATTGHAERAELEAKIVDKYARALPITGVHGKREWLRRKLAPHGREIADDAAKRYELRVALGGAGAELTGELWQRVDRDLSLDQGIVIARAAGRRSREQAMAIDLAIAAELAQYDQDVGRAKTSAAVDARLAPPAARCAAEWRAYDVRMKDMTERQRAEEETRIADTYWKAVPAGASGRGRYEWLTAQRDPPTAHRVRLLTLTGSGGIDLWRRLDGNMTIRTALDIATSAEGTKDPDAVITRGILAYDQRPYARHLPDGKVTRHGTPMQSVAQPRGRVAVPATAASFGDAIRAYKANMPTTEYERAEEEERISATYWKLVRPTHGKQLWMRLEVGPHARVRCGIRSMLNGAGGSHLCMELWERLDRDMTLATGRDIASAAVRVVKRTGVSIASAVAQEIDRYDRRPVVTRLKASGKTVRKGTPVEKPEAPEKAEAPLPPDTPPSPRPPLPEDEEPTLAYARRFFREYAEKEAAVVPMDERRALIREFCMEVNATLTGFRVSLQRAVTSAVAHVPRSRMVAACRRMSITVPKAGQPVNMKDANSRLRKLAGPHHPDLTNGDPRRNEIFKELNEAHQTVKTYNAALKGEAT